LLVCKKEKNKIIKVVKIKLNLENWVLDLLRIPSYIIIFNNKKLVKNLDIFDNEYPSFFKEDEFFIAAAWNFSNAKFEIKNYNEVTEKYIYEKIFKVWIY